jgi:hypothetical protein
MNIDSTATADTALTREAALAQGLKAIKGAGTGGLKLRMKRHNDDTFTTALQCAAHGMPVIVVHSIGDDGQCTCQYKRKEREAEGHKVVPCVGKQRGKHPKGFKWEATATTSYDQIVARWSGVRGYLNVGVMTGGDLIAIDFDGEDGNATRRQWEDAGMLPETVEGQSGGGGYHLYYTVPDGARWDIRNSANTIGRAVDVRGKGGQCVEHGSRHYSGADIDDGWNDGAHTYMWVEGRSPDEIALSVAPGWLLNRCFFAFESNASKTSPDGTVRAAVELVAAEEKAPIASVQLPPDGVEDTGVDDDPWAAVAQVIASEHHRRSGLILGYGDGGDGFDSPIYSHLISYFMKYGYEQDAAEVVKECIAAASVGGEQHPGHRDRYVDPSYYDRPVERARARAKTQGAPPHRRDAPEPAAKGLGDTEEIDTAIAEITDESTGAQIEKLMRRVHATADLDENKKRMLVRRIGRQIGGVDTDLKNIMGLWTDVGWKECHARPDTTDMNEVRAYMNRRYASVRWGKDFVYVDMTRPAILPVAGASLASEYKNTKIVFTGKDKAGKPEEVTIRNWFVWWTGQPDVPRFDGVTFTPRGFVASNILNLYRPSDLKPTRGDWNLLRRHIYENICNGNPYRFAYFMCTLASWVQRPDVKNGVAIALRGVKGSGKSLVFEFLCMLFPNNSGTIASSDELFSSFTAGTAYQIVTVLDEAVWAGSAKQDGMLKNKITSPKQPLHPKGFDAIEIDDYHHFAMTTNAKWVVPATFDERRFFVLDVNGRQAKDTKYFGAIVRQMESGGLEGFLYDLLRMDIPEWIDLRNPPQTKALIEQAALSADAHVQWWAEVLENGEIVVPKDIALGGDTGAVQGWPDAVMGDDGKPVVAGSDVLELTTREVQLSYEAFATRHREYRAINTAGLGKYLADLCEERGAAFRVRATGVGRPWSYRFPALAKLREWFTEDTGYRFDERDVTALPAALEPVSIMVKGESREIMSAPLAAWAMWGVGAVVW